LLGYSTIEAASIKRQVADVLFMFQSTSSIRFRPGRAGMADQIVITEKTSQAKDVRAAVGTRYGKNPSG